VRMIERWFPCAEVSEASERGWGKGTNEKALFTWFAARPLAQAKAAVLTSLLPWPDDETEQRRLQDLVRRAMRDPDGTVNEVLAELAASGPVEAKVLDLFSGRAMIPFEAAKMRVEAFGVDYSPVAALAGKVLTTYPFMDWSDEPALPLSEPGIELPGRRLVHDVDRYLAEIGRRLEERLGAYYPKVNGRQPWGYLWAVTLPCQECGRRFPLTGLLLLRHPMPKRSDPGQAYRIEADNVTGAWRARIHDGAPTGSPTLVAPVKAGKAVRGKAAVCPFCAHPHPKALHTRLAQEGLGQDALLAVADVDDEVGKRFREPTAEELQAVEKSRVALRHEPPFEPGMPAVPDELIPENNGATIRPQLYGAKSYGDLCNDRQTLAFVTLARVIVELGEEINAAGVSPEYASALAGYAAATLVRKLKRSTRGSTLDILSASKSSYVGVGHIFTNEASVGFSYDYLETGLGDGSGTWASNAKDTVRILGGVMGSTGRPAQIERGTARSLRYATGSMSAVVTDPPYDSMVYYSDSSDLFFVWLKRALSKIYPDLVFTTDPHGVQEKFEELIVKEHGFAEGEHRTRPYYDQNIARAFAEARRVTAEDGVVTIVFGHGEPEVWHRLLAAVTSAGLVLTGSWPARTEAGGQQGKANIVTTLTMACRRAPLSRPKGRANLVAAEVRSEVTSRIPLWDAAGLAPADQLMASAGPAMEIVGRYEQVLDHLGEPVEPSRYLVVARKAVIDATSVPIENLPLDTFDARTRFALSWVRLYRRAVAAKSEARWQALAADLTMDDLKGVLSEADKGVRLAPAKDWKGTVAPTSSVIDAAMAMAKAWPNGLDEVAQVLVAAERDADDAYLWAALGYLSSLLPEGDPDAVAWTSLVRARRGIGSVARGVVSAQHEADQQKDRQRSLFDIDMAGEPS